MPKACSQCGRDAVIHVRYSGRHLCRDDFFRFFERRVKKELRKQGPFRKGARIVVGLSGGKDSIVTLRLLHDVFKDNPTVDVLALSVDEGIAGYRPPALRVAEELCNEIGVTHHVRSYAEDAGVTMDGVMQANPGHLACATCGPLRRRALNAGARALDATHVATGHNLDDVAQSVLMNVLKGDVDRLARLGPHKVVKEGLIPRIMPLRMVPEKEVALYAILKGWTFHDDECPYAVDATRGRYRDMLLELEAREPGTRHSLVSGYDRLAPALAHVTPATELAECTRCGEPAGGGGVCGACRQVASVRAPQPRDGS